MPIGTDTSSSTSGGTTTVGATVRDEGPGGLPRTIDVYLHIQSSKLVQESAPGGSPYAVDAQRLSVWWKDKTLAAGATLTFSYRVKRKAGAAYEGPAEGTLIVCDRGASTAFIVRRFCLCPPSPGSDSAGKTMSKGKKTVSKKTKSKAKRRRA